MARRLRPSTVAALALVLGFWAPACDVPGPGPDVSDVSPDVPSDATDGGDTDAPRPVGAPCDAPNQCVRGAMCIGNPNGVYSCMQTCRTRWARCEDGSVCTPVGNGSQVCYTGGATPEGETCNSNLQCEDGLLCIGVREGDYYCLPSCHVRQGGCESGAFCKPLTEPPKGYCRAKVGAECASGGDDCAVGLRCSADFPSEIATRLAPGYCTKRCSDDADCPSGSSCRTHPGTDVDVCFATCERDPDCQLGGDYTCLEAEDCAAEPGENRCNAFRDEADLCVPTELETWN